MIDSYELVGISPDDLDAIREQLSALPNKQAKLRWLKAFAEVNPAVDARAVIMQIRVEERRPRLRVHKQKSRNNPTAQGFTGEGYNMRHGTSGGKAFLTEQLWWAAVPSNRDGGVMEPVRGGVDMQPGRYGTNTQILRTPESFTGLAT